MPDIGTIITPHEFAAAILDSDRYPLLALDTEFDPAAPACRTTLHGVGLAGGSPDGVGTIGAFFPFNGALTPIPWDYFFNRVLLPIFQDSSRAVIMHPLKVDMQLIRARGLRDEDVKATLECTMSMMHIYDENLPKGLKPLGETILGVRGLKSYSATQKEMKRRLKEGKKTVKMIVTLGWQCYKEHRKKSKVEKVTVDPTWPSWQAMIMALPPKLLKKDVLAAIQSVIEKVVMETYQQQVDEMFSFYGATDALLTLALRNFLMVGIPGVADPIPEEHYHLLELETQVCHPVTTEIEEAGCKLDIQLLVNIEKALQKAIGEVEVKLDKEWGPSFRGKTDDEKFNPASPEQVAEIVWNVWNVRPPPWSMKNGEIKPKFLVGKKKGPGHCTTSDEVMQHLIHNNKKFGPKVADLMEFRRLSKMHSTFALPLLAYSIADPENRVHASFWPVGARTGRYSSSDPNFTQIPRPATMPWIKVPASSDRDAPPPGVRAVYTKKVEFKGWQVRSFREAFIAADGYLIVSVDLAQIENRLVAHESQDPTLLHIFRVWDCSGCGKSGETSKALKNCPYCNAVRGARDRTNPDQPARGGFCLGRDIHAMTAHKLGLVEKHGFAEGRQAAKCVSAETIILTSQGLRRLRDFHVGKHEVTDCWVQTPSGNVPVHSVIDSGKKQSLLVITKRGILRCSPDHRVMCAGGLVRADELCKGDIVPTPPAHANWIGMYQKVNVNSFGRGTKYDMNPSVDSNGPCVMTLDEKWGYLAGIIVGDGTVSNTSVSIAVGAGDEYSAWRHNVRQACTAVGLRARESKDRKRIYVGSRRAASFLRDLDIAAIIGKRFHIPWWVLQGSESVAWAYVAGIIDTDGTVNRRSNTNVTTKWPVLAGEWAMLCRSLGMQVSLEACWNKTYSRWYFRMHILTSGLKLLLAHAPLRCPWKSSRLQERVKAICYPNRSIDNKILLVIPTLDPSICVESNDPIQMMDLNVSTDDHLFVPNGVVVHNCVNHAYNYGMGAPTLARREGMSVKQARNRLDGMDKAYPYVRGKLHKRVREAVKNDGFITIFDGHLRRFLGPKILLDSKNFHDWEWEAVIREAVNVLAQGGTAVIAKRTSIAVRNRLRKLGESDPRYLLVRLLIQMHDELVYEAPKSIVKRVLEIVIEEFENVVQLIVPVIAEGAIGKSWYDAH